MTWGVIFMPRKKKPPTSPGWYYGRRIGWSTIQPWFVVCTKGKLLVENQHTLVPYKELTEFDWFGEVPEVQEALFKTEA